MCREGTVKTQSQEAVSADNEASASYPSGWGDGRAVPRQKTRPNMVGSWGAPAFVPCSVTSCSVMPIQRSGNKFKGGRRLSVPFKSPW